MISWYLDGSSVGPGQAISSALYHHPIMYCCEESAAWWSGAVVSPLIMPPGPSGTPRSPLAHRKGAVDDRPSLRIWKDSAKSDGTQRAAVACYPAPANHITDLRYLKPRNEALHCSAHHIGTSWEGASDGFINKRI